MEDDREGALFVYGEGLPEEGHLKACGNLGKLAELWFRLRDAKVVSGEQIRACCKTDPYVYCWFDACSGDEAEIRDLVIGCALARAEGRDAVALELQTTLVERAVYRGSIDRSDVTLVAGGG